MNTRAQLIDSKLGQNPLQTSILIRKQDATKAKSDLEWHFSGEFSLIDNMYDFIDKDTSINVVKSNIMSINKSEFVIATTHVQNNCLCSPFDYILAYNSVNKQWRRMIQVDTSSIKPIKLEDASIKPTLGVFYDTDQTILYVNLTIYAFEDYQGVGACIGIDLTSKKQFICHTLNEYHQKYKLLDSLPVVVSGHQDENNRFSHLHFLHSDGDRISSGSKYRHKMCTSSRSIKSSTSGADADHQHVEYNQLKSFGETVFEMLYLVQFFRKRNVIIVVAAEDIQNETVCAYKFDLNNKVQTQTLTATTSSNSDVAKWKAMEGTKFECKIDLECVASLDENFLIVLNKQHRYGPLEIQVIDLNESELYLSAVSEPTRGLALSNTHFAVTDMQDEDKMVLLSGFVKRTDIELHVPDDIFLLLSAMFTFEELHLTNCKENSILHWSIELQSVLKVKHLTIC